jgi:hypothetical protein
MRTKDTGGSAFPINTSNVTEEGACMPEHGMTLRDYFAAKAMSGILAGPEPVTGKNLGAIAKQIAVTAYTYADAMIEARDE